MTSLNDLPKLIARRCELEKRVERVKFDIAVCATEGLDAVWSLQLELVEAETALDHTVAKIAAARKAHRTGWPG